MLVYQRVHMVIHLENFMQNFGGWFAAPIKNGDGNAENGIGFTIDSEKL